MPRTLGTNLTADHADAVITPRHLVRIGSLRHATGGNASGANISWDSQTWTKFQVKVSRVTWDGPAASGFSLDYVLPPNLLSTFVGFGIGTVVELYETAALSSYGTDDVKALFIGELNGQWTLRNHRWSVRVTRATQMFPPWHVRPEDGYSEFARPGTYAIGDRTVTIEGKT